MGAGASIPDTESAITKEQWREIAGGDAAVADGVFDARAGADGTMPHPLSTQATAARLAPALRVDEAVIAEALPGMNRCFEKRLGAGRRIYKPLDLSAFTLVRATRDGTRFEFEPASEDNAVGLPLDLAQELAGSTLSPEQRAALRKALLRAHRCGGWFSRVGQGIAMLHASPCGGDRPCEVSYDAGCRFFNMADPFVKFDGSATPADKMHNHAAVVNELGGKDLSSATYSVMLSPWTFDQGEGYDGTDRATLANNLELGYSRHIERLEAAGAAGGHLDPVARALRQPPFDCYFGFPVGIDQNVMAPRTDIAVDVMWAAMEDMLFDGKVRSIGVCNVTTRALQALLENPATRVLPAAIQVEHHPYCYDEQGAYAGLVQYALGSGVAVTAHTPLAQGTRLETDAHLRTLNGLTPAQATIRFSLDKGVTVIAGAQELAHIRENQATPLGPGDAPDGAGVPAAFPDFVEQPHLVGMCGVSEAFRRYCHPAYGGTCRTDDAGHLWAHTFDDQPAGDEAAAERRRSVQLKEALVGKHALMFSQLKPIIDALPKRATALARRKVATAHLARLEAAGGHELAQMQVVPYAAFVAHGAVPRRSCRNAGADVTHVSAATLGDAARILFISQRWLRPDHPDDRAGTKHKLLKAAVEQWAADQGVATDDVYIWFDLACVDQDDFDELVRCINALGLYIACADAFISFEHPEYWGRAWCLTEQMFGDAAKIPRYQLKATADEGEGEGADTGYALDTIDAGELRQTLVDPSKGSLTVESDRPRIEMLMLVAEHLRACLWLGAISEVMTNSKLEVAVEAGEKAAAAVAAGDAAVAAGATDAIHGATRPEDASTAAAELGDATPTKGGASGANSAAVEASEPTAASA